MCRSTTTNPEAYWTSRGSSYSRCSLFLTDLTTNQKIGFPTKTDLISWWWDKFGFDFTDLNRTGYEYRIRLAVTQEGNEVGILVPCRYLVTNPEGALQDISTWDFSYQDILPNYRKQEEPQRPKRRPHRKKGPALYRQTLQEQAVLQDYTPEYERLLKPIRKRPVQPWLYQQKAYQKDRSSSKCWKDQRHTRHQYIR